jgi:precorrin-8X/cobalt-precorrin-8 methylmutase
MIYNKNPMGIEIKSFEIIEEIISENGWSFGTEDRVEKAIFKRVIHTSADFDYLQNLKIKQGFIEKFQKACTREVTIYTDTNMVLSGINKASFSKCPWQIKCFVSDPRSKELAEALQITRSMAAIKLAIEEPGEKIFVLGNAPTAIFQLLESLVQLGDNLIGVVGVPVGFVGAVESKQALYESEISCITALGRKGGSNIAAAIINALLYETVGRS